MKSDRRILATTLISIFLLALGGCGGGGGYSTPPPAADTTNPAVGPIDVPAGSTLNRTVTLNVSASDNVGVTEVRFYADNTLLGTVTTAPYAFDWDTSAAADGDHVLYAEAQDAAGNVGRSADLTVTVTNTVAFTVTLSGTEENPPVTSSGTAEALLTINLLTGAVSGNLTVTGITPVAAHIHDGFAGRNGGVLIGLDQDTTDPGLFTVPAGATLDAAGIDRLLAGALYVNVHTATFPGGEIRGQILTGDQVLRFTDLGGINEVPEVDTIARGRAAITANLATGTIVVHAQVAALDDATAAHVHEAYAGTTGPVLVGLTQDGTDAGHWFVEGGLLNAAGLEAFAAGRLYVNVHSPAHPGGEVRGQVLPDGIAVIHARLSGDEEVPSIDSAASGLAAVTLDETASRVTIHVNTRAIDDASNAHLHGGYGGVTGGVEVGLTQDGTNPAHWFAEEESLTPAQLDALLAGATYVNVHSPAHPAGEIRGQVIPDGILFAFGRVDGSAEVPPANADAAGTVAVTVDPSAMTLVAHVNTVNASDATAAHLHEAYAGISGPVAIPLAQDATELSRWSADVTLTADQLAAFRAGRLYANVHTPDFPAGEIRGQVVPPPVEVLFTLLSGAEEVPPVATAGTALAATTVDRETGAMTVHVRTTGIDSLSLTASHVHSAYAGINGGVTVGLTQDAGDATHFSVTEAALDDAGLADYLEGRFYVNVHTTANPGGEIRGQLAPREIRVLLSDMDGDQVVPPVVTTATGIVATTVDLERRSLFAVINASGADDATSAGIHVGATGTNGPEILPLQQSLSLVSQWSAMTEPLAATDFSAYRGGGLYAQVATPAQAAGEIRGQIVPPDAALFDDVAPTVTLASPGATVSGTVTLEADASDNQGVTVVRFLVDGIVLGSDTTPPYSFQWDTTMVADGDVILTATAEDAAGNVGTSADVAVTIQNGSGVTLTQIQTTVFTPICSGCHSGGGAALPSVMNLSTAADSFANLVNVQSLQVGTLDRVTPGNPDDSYLIRKLEGGPGIVGDQMPLGGALDQATIDMIRSWITDGAANN